MADKDNVFVIDDGTKSYVIKNMMGDKICTLHIRGGDIGILDRYKKLMDDFDEIIEPLTHVKFKNTGDAQFDEDWATIKMVERKLIDRINALFDMKDADKLFEKRHAFSTVNGVFYVENVLKMLGRIVGQEIEDESKKSQERMEKYLEDLKQDDRSTTEES